MMIFLKSKLADKYIKNLKYSRLRFSNIIYLFYAQHNSEIVHIQYF